MVLLARIPALTRHELILGWGGILVIFGTWIALVTARGRVPDSVFADNLFLVAFLFLAVATAGFVYSTASLYGKETLVQLILGVSINTVLLFITGQTAVPAYFGSAGSALVGFCAGPLAGMAVGGVTALIMALFSPSMLPLALLFIIPGGVMWFCLVDGWVSTVPRLIGVGLLLATGFSGVLVVTRLAVIGEDKHSGAHDLYNFFALMLNDPVRALVTSTLVIQVMDKLFLLFIGYLVLQYLLRIPVFQKRCVREPARSIAHAMSRQEQKPVAYPALASTDAASNAATDELNDEPEAPRAL